MLGMSDKDIVDCVPPSSLLKVYQYLNTKAKVKLVEGEENLVDVEVKKVLSFPQRGYWV